MGLNALRIGVLYKCHEQGRLLREFVSRLDRELIYNVAPAGKPP